MQREQDGEGMESIWVSWGEDLNQKLKVPKLKQRDFRKSNLMPAPKRDFRQTRMRAVTTSELNWRIRGDPEECPTTSWKVWAGCGRSCESASTIRGACESGTTASRTHFDVCVSGA